MAALAAVGRDQFVASRVWPADMPASTTALRRVQQPSGVPIRGTREQAQGQAKQIKGGGTDTDEGKEKGGEVKHEGRAH